MLYWLILSMMNSLIPSERPIHRHGELAVAIADTLEQEGPLFSQDKDLRRSSALLVAVAFRESSLTVDALGDKGTSFCAFQVHASSGGRASLLEDAHACARAGYRMLKESIRVDRAHPIAFYAMGPRYKNTRAIRISNDRMALATRLARLTD